MNQRRFHAFISPEAWQPKSTSMTRGVWRAAIKLISEHGEQAPIIVEKMIDNLRRGGAQEKEVAPWVLIDGAVRDLLKVSPEEDETVQ